MALCATRSRDARAMLAPLRGAFEARSSPFEGARKNVSSVVAGFTRPSYVANTPPGGGPPPTVNVGKV